MVDNVRNRILSDLKRKEAFISVQNNKYMKRKKEIKKPIKNSNCCLNLEIENGVAFPTNY